MPALEMAQETGKLVSWLKKEGEPVRKGEPLLEIETDKAVMEIESPGDGILAGIKAMPGAEVPVGRTIAWIVRPGEAPPAEESSVETGRRTTKPASSSPSASVTASSAVADKQLRISPKARRLAAEKGIDLSSVRGSGPDGEILADDVLKAASGSGPSPLTSSAAAGKSPSTFSRLMAERTLQSWTTVPHFFVVREVDAGALRDSRTRLSAETSSETKITYTDLLVFLIARVLVRHPRMNGTWTDQGLRENHEVNIALAIATEDAVVAPVIRNAHTASLAEIAHRRSELSERVSAGKLQPSDISGGTFTISNLGMLEVDAFSAIITPPQVAILAVGSMAERVTALDGKVAIRPMMTMTLSSDHRAVSGAHAAKFMQDLAEAIRNPNLPSQ